MKKLLLASTVLGLSAGAAAADVTVSGFGRFGIADADDGNGTYLEQRFQLDFVGTVETDAGLTVGGKFRARSYDDNDYPTTGSDSYQTTAATFNSAQMFVEGGGLKLEVGNVDYALDNMPGLALGNIGLAMWTSPTLNIPAYNSTGLEDFVDSTSQTRSAVSSTDTGVAMIYSMDGFTAHVSYGMTTEQTDLYASYDYAGYTFALGYMDTSAKAATEWAVAVSGSLSMFDFNLSYTDNKDAKGAWALGAHYDVNSAMDVGLYVTYFDKYEYFDSSYTKTGSETGVGADFGYDLGNGVGLHGGVYGIADKTAYDFGISFDF